MQRVHNASAEIRLGEFLAKRCIKPGAVVTQWSTSRGMHAGELSKKEFRDAVIKLGLGSSGVTEADIDGVFDKFDEVSIGRKDDPCRCTPFAHKHRLPTRPCVDAQDLGGYLDAQEATAMVKELQTTAKAAQQEVTSLHAPPTHASTYAPCTHAQRARL